MHFEYYERKRNIYDYIPLERLKVANMWTLFLINIQMILKIHLTEEAICIQVRYSLQDVKLSNTE